VDVISSTSNPTVRSARRLASARGRRGAGGRFLLEGPEGIRAALAAGHPPAVLLATEAAAARHAGLVNQARRGGAEVALVAERLLAGLADTSTPQGLVAVVPSVVAGLDGLPAAPRLVCVLVEARDPGNAGTVIRTADAFGADAVVLTAGSVDPEHPRAVRAAAGSLFHLPVLAGVAWPALRAALRDRGLRLVGADPHAADAVSAAPLHQPTALVLGSEAHGLPATARDDLDLVVRLPMHGRAESLNLAAAAAVLLYEAANQQRTAHRKEAAVGR
jgi:RNA methyltransferase, TrmH family